MSFMRSLVFAPRAAVMGARGVPAFAPARCVFAPQARCFSVNAPRLARSGRDVPEPPMPQDPRGSGVQEHSAQSEYDALTPVARKYVSRVYANTAAGAVTMATGAGAMLFTPLGATVSPIVCTLAGFATMGALMFGYGKTPQTRLAMFHGFAGLTGAGLAKVVAVASYGGILGPAVALTGATFAGFSAAALMAPKGSSVKMQGPLYACMFGLIAVQIMGLFFPTPLGSQLMMYGGLALFSMFVASDTGAMIERANAGAEDVVSDSINMLINLMQIFTRIVMILRGDD